MDDQQFRAELDASVDFTNGGHLAVAGFRVDVPGPDVTQEQAAELVVRSLGLLMSGRVEVSAFRVFPEPHKGTRGGPSAGAAPRGDRRLVELSHVISAGMVTLAGLPAPEIRPHLTREDSRARYAEGVEFEIDRISMVGNTGTYLDSPFHRYAEGDDLSALPLDILVDLPAVLVRTAGSAGRGVGVGEVAALEVEGCAVLLDTGSDAYFGAEDYQQRSTFLTAEAARWLVEHGARLVGIDSANVDDVGDLTRPAHSILLGSGIPVVEHLTGLEQLPPTGARFSAVPLRVAGFGTFPVRAYAVV